MIKSFFSIVMMMFIASNAICLADDSLKVSASVDKTKLAADDVVQFTITIEGMDSVLQQPKIDLPELEENFTIVATSQSNSINMIGRTTQINWQLRYSLIPKREGEIIIESATVFYKRKTFTTESLTLTVSPPSTPKSLPPQKDIPQKVPWSEKEGITI